MFFPLRLTSDILSQAEGPNDGLVSSYSARWGERETTWNCDHPNQIGWVGNKEGRANLTFDIQKGYEEILERLKKIGY